MGCVGWWNFFPEKDSFLHLTYHCAHIGSVAAGEELCISYVELYAPVTDRRARLLSSKRFECQCPRCVAEARGKSGVELSSWLCKSGACSAAVPAGRVDCPKCRMDHPGTVRG